MSTIVPAIIPESLDQLKIFGEEIAPLPEIHVDVVDGKFVDAISWPYDPLGDPMMAKTILDRFSLEVDLMIFDPIPAAERWIAAGADLLVFHVETISPQAFADFAHQTSITIGISALNDTPDETLAAYIPHADYVQVMGIRKIGSQGLPFDEFAKERIVWIKQTFPNASISLDGSVNHHSLPDLCTLPVQRFIVGSAITKAPLPLVAYHELSAFVS
jgi:ribulose-phosphate 3-epimerase